MPVEIIETIEMDDSDIIKDFNKANNGFFIKDWNDPEYDSEEEGCEVYFLKPATHYFAKLLHIKRRIWVGRSDDCVHFEINHQYVDAFVKALEKSIEGCSINLTVSSIK